MSDDIKNSNSKENKSISTESVNTQIINQKQDTVKSSSPDKNETSTQEKITENEDDIQQYEKFLDPSLMISKDNKSEIKEFICYLCKGILYDPVFDKCGHIFCRRCLIFYFKTHDVCPIDKNIINKEFSPMILIKNIINSKETYCKNKEKGCNWQGLFKDLPDHLNNICPKEIIQCTFKECKERIERSQLELHKLTCEYRLVKCEDCQNEFPYSVIILHKNLCNKMKIKCNQNCGLILQRDLLKNHIQNDCPNTIVDCLFKKYGCEEKVFRKELRDKLNKNMIKHMSLVIDKFEKDINELKKNQETFFNFINKFNIIEKKIIINKATKKLKNKKSKTNNIIINNNNNSTNYKNGNSKYLNKKRSHHSITQNRSKKDKKEQIPEAYEDEEIYIIDEEQFNREKYTKKTYFDIKNLVTGIDIVGNRITYNSKRKNEHIYVFLDNKFDIDLNDKKEKSFTLKLFCKSSWLAFGLCDKEKVLLNKGKFCMPSISNFNNGSFLISINGYSWNCNVLKENNVPINFPNIHDEGIEKIFKVVFNPKKFILSFFIKNKNVPFATLTKVLPISGNNVLTPCIVFIFNGDSVEVYD